MAITPYTINYENITRGNLIGVNIADIHFGAADYKYQYDILYNQFIQKIKQLDRIDFITINGDLYDHKFMSNSPVISYVLIFIDTLIQEVCIPKNATLLILNGTASHDGGQLSLLYKYTTRADVDVRIREACGFENIKGARVLCVPEEYNKDSHYYEQFLFNSGLYDLCFFHGEFENTIYNEHKPTLDGRLPVFKLDDFRNCKGTIIGGHVHTPGCHQGYVYYCGSPYRWQFGEEHEKGYLISLHNLDDGSHYIHFEKIKSMTYNSIDLSSRMDRDPRDVIKEIETYKSQKEIDYLRVIFDSPGDTQLRNIQLIKKYFANNKYIKIKYNRVDKIKQDTDEKIRKLDKYNYVLDKSLDEYDIFIQYVNDKEGENVITKNELIDLLQSD